MQFDVKIHAPSEQGEITDYSHPPPHMDIPNIHTCRCTLPNNSSPEDGIPHMGYLHIDMCKHVYIPAPISTPLDWQCV